MQKCYTQNKTRRGDWRKYKKGQHWRAETFPDSVYNNKGHWEGSCSLSIQSSRSICYQSQCHTDCASSLICKRDGSSPDSAFILNQCRRIGDKHHYMMLLFLRFNFLRKTFMSLHCLSYSIFLFPHHFWSHWSFSAEFDGETHLKAMKILPVL